MFAKAIRPLVSERIGVSEMPAGIFNIHLYVISAVGNNGDIVADEQLIEGPIEKTGDFGGFAAGKLFSLKEFHGEKELGIGFR
jgi:hypothetical protein